MPNKQGKVRQKVKSLKERTTNPLSRYRKDRLIGRTKEGKLIRPKGLGVWATKLSLDTKPYRYKAE